MMKNIFLFLIAVLVSCNPQVEQNSVKQSENEYSNFEPTLFPDRIMLSIPGDPATSRAVSWRTLFTITESVAQITPVVASPGLEKDAITKKGTSTPWEEGSQVSMGHKVVFENLKPATKYAYRVGDGERWSEWLQFKTSSAEDGPFTFLYFGDVQNDIKSLGSRTVRQAYTHFPEADFMLFAGDLVSRSTEEYWREFFYAGGWIFGMMPSVVTPGNHEYDKPENQPRTFSKHWNQIYSAPANSPSEEYYNRNYYLDYQGVRFISFDSPALGENEEDSVLVITWLDKTLAENPNRWTVLFTHYPVYSCSQGRNNEKYRNTIKPLLEKYGVDLVLAGHDHTYCRGFNPEGIEVRGKNMPLYVVSVAGPKMYGLNTSFWSERMASLTQLYQYVSVSREKLEFKAFTVAGELYDHFVISKTDNGMNTFLESPEVAAIVQRTEIPESALENYSEDELEQYQKKFNK